MQFAGKEMSKEQAVNSAVQVAKLESEKSVLTLQVICAIHLYTDTFSCTMHAMRYRKWLYVPYFTYNISKYRTYYL